MTDIAKPDGFRLATVFGKSFDIFSRRFVPIILVTIIAQIPNYVAQFTVSEPKPGMTLDALMWMLGGLLVAFFIGIVAGSLSGGVVMYGVIQELRGRRFSAVESFSVVLARLLPVIGVALCSGILIILGLSLLIVPGLILACMWYVAVPVCIAERTGVFASMSRSRVLTKGYRWRLFGILLLFAIAVLIGIFTIGMVFAMVSPTALKISQLAVGTIIGAFGGVLGGVFYYELRVAKEGVDIDKIASVFD